MTPNLPPDPPLVFCKRLVEDAVRASGMTWTILQPSAFMEVHLSSLAGWNVAGRRATIIGPGNTPISYVSYHDVAAIGVLTLTEDGFEDRCVPVGGPESLRPLDVVRICEAVTGEVFKVRHVPLGAIRPWRGLPGSLTRPDLRSSGWRRTWLHTETWSGHRRSADVSA